MTKQHRATPEQWETIEQWAEDSIYSACFIELRARIEALEAAQPPQDKLDRLIALDADDGDPIVMPSSPSGSLIDRVAQALYDAPNTLEGGWHTGARAAILEVAAWFRAERDSPETAAALEQEANR
jgi:hypothetical protein